MPFFVRPRLRLCTLLLAIVLAGLTACRPSGESAAAPELPGHPVTGEIVRVDLERGTLLVDHEEIPDYMPPMVMEFRASPGDLAIAKPGQRIRARLIEDADGGVSLAHIWPADPLAASQVNAAAAALRQEVTILGTKAYREVGENVLNFTLYDQDGRVVSIDRFRGKKVLLNFIYTRCPIQTMCPAAVLNMRAVQAAVAEAGESDRLALVSISFDPDFDTPGVLREYVDARGIDTSNYHFLTGPRPAIEDLLRQFGVLAQLDGSLINHTLATLLIDENGRIIDRADGSQWDPRQFVGKILR